MSWGLVIPLSALLHREPSEAFPASALTQQGNDRWLVCFDMPVWVSNRATETTRDSLIDLDV